MDLLLELNEGPIRAKTYEKNIDVEESDSENSDNEQEESDVYNQAAGYRSTLDDTNLNAKKYVSAPDFSILDRVRRRLNGEPEPVSVVPELEQNQETQLISTDEAPTQMINESCSQKVQNEIPSQTQVIPKKFSSSSLFSANIDPTQVIGSTQKISQNIESHRDLSSVKLINSNDTQKIEDPQSLIGASDKEVGSDADEEAVSNPEAKKTDLKSLFMSSDEENDEVRELTRTERAKRLEALVAAKRAQRTEAEKLKDKEREELEADLTRATLTDEENDERDTSGVMGTVDPVGRRKKTDADFLMRETARMAREAALEPKMRTALKFTKEAFLSDFMNDTHSSPVKQNSSPSILSTPSTSPIKAGDKMKEILLSDTDASDDEVEGNVLDFFKEDNAKESKEDKHVNNPLLSYQQKLKNGSNFAIDLDSESDSEMRTKESKVTRLEIKTKFQKKMAKDGRDISITNKTLYKKKNFFSKLHSANKEQLIQNRRELLGGLGDDNEVTEDKDREVESLLEREMERVRRIKKKEREMAKSVKGATEEKPFEWDESEEENEIAYNLSAQVEESDIDESEIEGSESEADDESSDGENESEGEKMSKRKSKKNSKTIISDDDDDEVDIAELSEKQAITSNAEAAAEVEADAIGYDFVRDDISNDQIKVSSFGMDDATQDIRNVFGISMSQAFKDSQPVVTKASNIFQQLRENGNQLLGEDDSEIIDQSFDKSFQSNDSISKLFQNRPKDRFDIDESAIVQTQTQSSVGDASQIKRQLLSMSLPPSHTQADGTQVDGSDADDSAKVEINATQKDDEDIDEEPVKNAFNRKLKKLVKKTESDIESDDENDEATMLLKMKIFKEKQRIAELRSKKKRREYEKKGIRKIVDGEAVESEDEWHGIGGIDGELSDKANSEDEKMIDDNFNVDLKLAEIREKIMKDGMVADKEELEKLLDDIKNHRLTKRRALGTGLDLESSDGEDYILQAFHKQKAAKQRERLLANKQMQELSKDKKAQAFFASIQDETTEYKLDDGDGENAVSSDDEDGGKTDEDNPFVENKPKADEDKENEAPEAMIGLKRRKVGKITEAYVQQALSFLDADEEGDEFEKMTRISKIQHGFDSSDDEDIHSLKKRSIIKLSGKQESIDLTESNKRTASAANLEEDYDTLPTFKKPSITKSYRSFIESKEGLVKDGNKGSFAGVTVNKTYKVATGSKASITSFASNKPVRTLKVERLQRDLKSSRTERKNIFNSGKFDN